MKIHAIDLGKFKRTACVLDTTSNDHAFEAIRTKASERHLPSRQTSPKGMAASPKQIAETSSQSLAAQCRNVFR